MKKKEGINRCIFHNHPHITDQQEWIPTRAQWVQVRTLFKYKVEEAVKGQNVTVICNAIRDHFKTNTDKNLDKVSDLEIVKQVLDPRSLNLNYNKNRVKMELSRDFANYIKRETGYTNGRSKWIYNNLFGPNGKVTLFNRTYYPEKMKVWTPPEKIHEGLDKKTQTPAGRRSATREKMKAISGKYEPRAIIEEGAFATGSSSSFSGLTEAQRKSWEEKEEDIKMLNAQRGEQVRASWGQKKEDIKKSNKKKKEEEVTIDRHASMHDTSTDREGNEPFLKKHRTAGGKKKRKKRKKRTKKRRRRKKKTRKSKRKKKRTKKKRRKRKKRTRRRR